MLRIRPANVDDVALLRTMIRELAEFEHELEWVTIREEDLARDGFSDHPRFRALLRTMIRELAEFEHELEWVTIREEDLARDGFGENPRFRALMSEWDGQPAGYALFFNYFSTWVGRGLFLEDLFVRENFRKKGIGTSLLAEVARIAVDERCYGIHWEVLDWNQKAIELYKALGAEFRDQWRPVLLTGEALHRLAAKSRASE